MHKGEYRLHKGEYRLHKGGGSMQMDACGFFIHFVRSSFVNEPFRFFFIRSKQNLFRSFSKFINLFSIYFVNFFSQIDRSVKLLVQ